MVCIRHDETLGWCVSGNRYAGALEWSVSEIRHDGHWDGVYQGLGMMEHCGGLY